MFLVGSQALNFHLGKIPSKSDWDIVASEEEVNEHGLSFEGRNSFKHEDIEFLNSSILLNDQIKGEGEEWHKGFRYLVADLESLYIIKRSHAHRPLKFSKTIHDLRAIKEKLKEEGNWPVNLPLLHRRIEATKALFGDKAPSLDKSNEDFFDDFVTKKYVHDDLHRVVAHYDSPIYEKMKFDKSKAHCDKKLWDMLDHEDKILCVREECYVIALERFIIPLLEKGERVSERLFFFKALERICTNLTSGYFRDFAIDNFWEISDYKLGFVEKFKNWSNK